jgi:F0F1-type ATP synthase membrane subunit b/b'
MEEAATSGLSALLIPAINLSILIAFLVVKVKQPLRAHVKARHEGLKEQLLSVREKLAKSQERYDEFTAKLKTVEGEITAMREQARQDAKSSQERIVAEAKKLSTTIVTEARSAAGNLYADLRASC